MMIGGEHPLGLVEGGPDEAVDGAEEGDEVEFGHGRFEPGGGMIGFVVVGGGDEEGEEEEGESDVLRNAEAAEFRGEDGREDAPGEEGRGVLGLRRAGVPELVVEDDDVDDVGKGEGEGVDAVVGGGGGDALSDEGHHEGRELDGEEGPVGRGGGAGHGEEGRGELSVGVPRFRRPGSGFVDGVRHRVRRPLVPVAVAPAHRRGEGRRGVDEEKCREEDRREFFPSRPPARE
mmetsp:Transcript_463/g.1672  ORF Transcript_463/g.1672 Transcript_463/m.1672 type:complete len:232 (+) Transcript_463:273-968(+)